MRDTSRTKPFSDFVAHASEVLAEVAEQRRPLVLTENGEPKAVLQDMASYTETQETRALLTMLALGQQDVDAGRVKPAADVVARLRAKRARAGGRQ
ncbi:antitoxin, Phd family protein [Rubrivivax gelatinosus]|uniref:Antitoxin n=1 Tax=Rubrivivax gelatinosus TaxID=28068 RepID=A0ABS1DZQ1_RUBGE|nr:type II toxin-antitoxin system Phd/YefM family antitoxin [Rubrivivax gelatinosus]MBK1616415.1 antitoxin, Phd family protein [Rubrivivax gelatinosus]MBK1714993.1 antitoxin, Phd family protein [Rubrivivax gelatinosus]MBZ8144005.1 antitoxin, Phd family protein [Rubrivivax gelatinosus]